METNQLYYWEKESGFGGPYKARFTSDQAAIEWLTKVPNLLMIYKESNTVDGMPFIAVWEKKQ